MDCNFKKWPIFRVLLVYFEGTTKKLRKYGLSFLNVIIYMQKIQHDYWLRARQLIPNSAES